MKPLTWDEAKRRSNLQKHGLDFAHVADFDETSALTFEDRRGLIDPKFAYPEPRYLSLGLMRGSWWRWCFRRQKRAGASSAFGSRRKRKASYGSESDRRR